MQPERLLEHCSGRALASYCKQVRLLGTGLLGTGLVALFLMHSMLLMVLLNEPTPQDAHTSLLKGTRG